MGQPAGTEPAVGRGPDSGASSIASTGSPDVDAALSRLAAAEGVPLGRQADIYEQVHRALQGVLDATAS